MDFNHNISYFNTPQSKLLPPRRHKMHFSSFLFREHDALQLHVSTYLILPLSMSSASPLSSGSAIMVILFLRLGVSAKHLREDVSTTVSQKDTTGSATFTSMSVGRRGGGERGRGGEQASAQNVCVSVSAYSVCWCWWCACVDGWGGGQQASKLAICADRWGAPLWVQLSQVQLLL